MKHTGDSDSNIARNSNSNDSRDNTRLTRALMEYLEALEAGQRPQRDAILNEYADIDHELAECLESIDFIHDVSPHFEISSDDSRDGIDQQRSETSPKSLGDFRLLRELGRGGMGIVYEAEQSSVGRRVALKILPFAALLNQTQLERFNTEATAAARLHHPGIVQVYSVGCERGIHFYSMQLIDGPSLSDVIAEMRNERHLGDESAETVVAKQAEVLTRDEDGGHYRAVARIGKEAAEALHYAHENGVLHRDIKPSNLLLNKTGRVRIADFGLARVEDESQLTRTGDILGTLRYMSPEQATGERVDARTDVYSLGATLYELATLQPVYDSEDKRDIIKQVLAGNPTLPHLVDSRIPKPLSYVISKAMARLDDRYQSAQELATDLQRFLDGEPVSAKPPTLLRRARAWSRRHRMASAAIVGLLILVLILPFTTHHFFQRSPDASHTKGPDMNVSKTAKVAAAAAAMAMVTAGVNAKKPVPPDPDPGLTVHFELWGADYVADYETSSTCGVLVEQQDGKFLVPGIFIPTPGQYETGWWSQVTRWNMDGTVDTTFGNIEGKFAYDFGDSIGNEGASDVVVQPDGKIVLVGTWGEWHFPFIARLNTDGSLDESFGNPETPGIVDDPILNSPTSQFSTAIILGDGSIVTAGRFVDTITASWTICPLLVKFRPDGTLDPNFGQNGVSYVNLGGDSIVLSGDSLAELEDGRLVAAGTGPNFETSTIFMFNSDGTLDLSFGNNGLAEVDFDPGGVEMFHSFVIQPDGKIVAVGGVSSDMTRAKIYHNWDRTDRFTIARFNQDGTLDKRNFAKPWGAKELDLAPGGDAEFSNVELLSDGKILAVGIGRPQVDGSEDIYFARFSSKGQLDESFDQDGWINFDIMDCDEYGVGLLVLGEGSYLVSGFALDPVFGWTQFLGRVWEE